MNGSLRGSAVPVNSVVTSCEVFNVVVASVNQTLACCSVVVIVFLGSCLKAAFVLVEYRVIIA